MNANRGKIVPAILIIIAVIAPLFIPSLQEETEEEPIKARIQMPEIEISLPDVSLAFEVKENRIKAKAIMDDFTDISDKIDEMEFPTTEVVLTSLGVYYITGYTSWELNGSVQTASGAICHKADSIEDSLNNPTTCAIDPSLHDFGDVFYLESFGYYIAEDTGSAVLGKHLDLYYGLTYEDNQEALTITGYYEVFSVEYVYGSEKASKYDITSYFLEDFIDE